MTTTDAPLVYNPYDATTNRNPFPVYARLRREAPVYRNEDLGFYALSKHDDVLAALHDTEVFCSRHGITLEPRSPLPLLLTMDPPEHTDMRSLISRGFTPRRVAAMEEQMRALSRKHLDRFRDAGTCDLIADYSGRLPMDVISTMLGVPEEDQEQMRIWSDAMMEREDGNPDIPPAGIEAGANVYNYFTELVAERRRHPTDDLTSAFLEAELDGEGLSDLQVVSFCFLFIVAGNETTTKLIGNALYWLAAHPDQRAAVYADPSRIPDVVEEVLRYEGSTQQIARTLTADATVRDVTMPEGSKVLLLLGSANRDEDVFVDPEVFDIDRRPTRHIAFGHGAHVCLGAAMARLEARLAIEDLHEAMTDYAFDEDTLVRFNSGNVRGYASMPMTFTPR
ncbi:MAG: cytochrome P450 [Acidimicrobiales bacterium]